MSEKTSIFSLGSVHIVALVVVTIAALMLGYMDFSVTRPIVAYALLGGAIAALGTALDTLPVLVSKNLSRRAQDTMLGFGAGVMLAACSFSLIMPGIESAREIGAGEWGSGLIVAASILLGARLMFLIERYVPHEHFVKGGKGKMYSSFAEPGCLYLRLRCIMCLKGLPLVWGLARKTSCRRLP